MRDDEYKQFSELWLSFCAGRQGKLPAPKALAVIFGALKDLSLDDVRRGLIIQSRQSEFMPTAASVLNCAKGRPEDRAIVAWLMVQKAMRKLGSRTSVRFEDPAASFAVDALGGWYDLVTAEKTDWQAKRFSDAYIAAVNLGITSAMVPDHFPGDRENRSSDWRSEDIVTISGMGEGGRLLFGSERERAALEAETAMERKRIA